MIASLSFASSSASSIAKIDNDQISGNISEAPASWTMEAGHILPEPGEEPPEWYLADNEK